MGDRRPHDRNPGTRKEYDQLVRTICQECTVRCGIVAYLKGDVIVDIHGDHDHPVSRGRLCSKGIAFVQGLNSPHRITRPAFRKSCQEPFEALEDWENALDLCAEKLRKIRDQHGPESILISCNQEAGLDFTIGAIRFAKLLGTPHIYYPFDFPSEMSDPFLPLYPAPPCYEWNHNGCIFLIETDMATTHPVAFGWALDAQQRGAKIIAADVRFTRTMSKADIALRIMPHMGNILGLALMKMILKEAFYDADITRTRFTEPEIWKASFEQLSWKDLENVIGITAKKLRELGALLHENGPAVIVTGGKLANLPNYGIWRTLVTAAGWFGTKGGGWYPLDTTTPPLDPEQGIGVETHSHESLKDLEEISNKGNLPVRALLCSGDCFSRFFSTGKDLATDLDLIAYFGSFPNSTVALSHMVFPSALWAERSSLCFSNDRVVHWGEKIVEPMEQCRSGLDFWLGLARRFGWHDEFPWMKEEGSIDYLAFYQWLLDGSPTTRGCKLDQIRESNQVSDLCFWSFEEQRAGKIDPTHAPDAIESPVQGLDKERYPLYFERSPAVSRSGEASHWWPWSKELENEEAIQINPETARALNIESGEEILISNPAGTLEGRAWISRMVPRWMVSSPRGSNGEWVLVRRKDQTSEEALSIIREFLQ